MRKRLKILAMSGLAATALLSSIFTSKPAHAESGGITASTDENGRKIYVNDGTSFRTSVPGTSTTGTAPHSGGSASGSSGLVYWSSTEHRYKPVPTSGAIMRAARSAASEVNTYLSDKRGTEAYGHQTLNVGFSAADIDAA